MDDDGRGTWAGVFLILGVTVLAGGGLRWIVWYQNHVEGDPLPEALWTLGSLGVAFVLAAVSLVWPRSTDGAARKSEDWTLP